MKIILIDVISLDGKLTKWDQHDTQKWASKEDHEHFLNTIKQHEVLIMGSGTFDAIRTKPEKGRLRIVMTKNPYKYLGFREPGQLEFTDETPEQLVLRLKKLKYKKVLFVGGAALATAFLKAKLIDELWLTIEPKIFGLGKNMIALEKLDIKLELLSKKKLNTKGTILLKYRILK